MSLSKQQTIGAVGAGVFLVLAGGLGWMLYSAWSDRTDAETRRDDLRTAFENFNSAPVFPSKGSIASVKSNETSYATWYTEAVDLAARGDKLAPEETPPIFKQRLQAEVRRMAALPGGANGKISSAEFLFGFEQYLGEGGVLPQSADVPRLATQLDTIASVVDMCAEAGVLEIKSVQRIEPRKDVDEDGGRGRNKKKAKSKKAADDELKQTCLEYAFEVTTRPAAMVALLNDITSTERFCVVKNLSFRESADMIVDKIAAVEAAAAQKSRPASSSRRRRRGGDAAEEPASAGTLSKDDRVVVDPELDAPILVKFNLAVYDFGRAAAPAAATEKPAESSEKKEGN